jgi:hypothetical protein
LDASLLHVSRDIMKGVFFVALVLACTVAMVRGQDPPQPLWPSEVHFSVVGEAYSLSGNYSYSQQKLLLGADFFGEQIKFLVSCAKNNFNSYYETEFGTVCYIENDDLDIDEFCPLPTSPFSFLFTAGNNLTYAGTVRSGSQTLYSWMEGYNSVWGCQPCTFYWETAQWSTSYRTPIAYNPSVWLEGFGESPASYFVDYYFNPSSTAVQPVNEPRLPCHEYNPPFFPTKKASADAAPAEEKKKVSLKGIIPKMQEFATKKAKGETKLNFMAYLKQSQK